MEERQPRNQKVTVQIEHSNLAWLWRERRRRERSIAWIVNQAITQYRERIERPKVKKNGKRSGAAKDA